MICRKKYATILAGAALLAITVFSSCKKNMDNPATPNSLSGSGSRTTATSATVNLHLMDAPGRFDAVNIDIKSILVRLNDSTWDTVALFRPGIYNLLNFKDDMDTLVASTLLPPGNITKMEMLVGTDNSVVVRGNSYPLTLPSAAHNLIRVWTRFNMHAFADFGFGIDEHRGDSDADDEDFDDGFLKMVAGAKYDIYMDFDVAMSVRRMGHRSIFDWDRDHDGIPTTFMLSPVVRAFVKANTGRLTGEVLPLSAMPTIYASNGLDVFTALTNSGGHFMFGALPAGTYQVIINPSDSTLTADTLSGVAITANSVTNVGVITLH